MTEYEHYTDIIHTHDMLHVTILLYHLSQRMCELMYECDGIMDVCGCDGCWYECGA